MIANRFWVAGTETWNSTAGAKWGTLSGVVDSASLPGTGDVAIFDALSGGGTVTVDSPNGAGVVTVQQITMGAFTGTLDFSANNNNVTLQIFSGTGAGVRTLNMGNGTWLMTSFNANVWDITTATNLTLNANSSVLSFIPSTPTPTGSMNFVGGGRSYNIVTHSGVTNSQAFAIQGAPTIATLSITAPANVTFAQGTTTTITNAPSWLGSSVSQLFIGSSTSTGIATVVLSAAGGVAQWAAIRGLTVTTNALTATNSFDLKSNTLVTITPPATGGGSSARIISG